MLFLKMMSLQLFIFARHFSVNWPQSIQEYFLAHLRMHSQHSNQLSQVEFYALLFLTGPGRPTVAFDMSFKYPVHGFTVHSSRWTRTILCPVCCLFNSQRLPSRSMICSKHGQQWEKYVLAELLRRPRSMGKNKRAVNTSPPFCSTAAMFFSCGFLGRAGY